MPYYSKKSKAKLATCHEELQLVFNEVINYFDCTIICGYRDEEHQNRYFDEGKTKLKYPESKHNRKPSLAIDVAPYNNRSLPIDWHDGERFYYFAGFVLGVAYQLGVKLRCGADWNMDTHVKDTKFKDLVHFELVR